MFQPALLSKNILSDNLPEKLLCMNCDSSAKDDFEVMSLTAFWEKKVSVAIRTLLTFGEKGFSAQVNVKAKPRNKLYSEVDMKLALSVTKSQIQLLVCKKQPHLSHRQKICSFVYFCRRSAYIFWSNRRVCGPKYSITTIMQVKFKVAISL